MLRYLVVALFLVGLSYQHAGWKIVNTIKNLNELNEFENYIGCKNTSDDQYFQQELDHFNPQIKETFYQRYAYRKTEYKKENKVVILYIEGESAMSPSRLESGFIVDLAKRYGAFLVHMEHRFYGKSVPDQKLNLDKMSFLTAEQALEDLVFFVHHLKERFGFSNHKFILVGGSYAGMLSSWGRIKYPHIFYASLASSAPVKATLEFSDYEKVVTKSLSNEAVGGSKQCSSAVSDVFDMITKMIEQEDTKEINQKLHPCTRPMSKKDWWVFTSNLRGIFDGAVQYNAKERTINVAKVCDLITTDEDLLDSLSLVVNFYLENSEEECLDSSYDLFIEDLKNEKVNSMRSWYYQTCTEFGFYQDCIDGAKCLFVKTYSVNYDMNVCLDAYGINTHMISGYIGLTNTRYGHLNPETSRIIYTNGDIDPWHALGILKDRSEYEQEVLYTADGSHCQELHSASQGDSSALVETREKIISTFDGWLEFEQ